jgi:hypothetical protein
LCGYGQLALKFGKKGGLGPEGPGGDLREQFYHHPEIPALGSHGLLQNWQINLQVGQGQFWGPTPSWNRTSSMGASDSKAFQIMARVWGSVRALANPEMARRASGVLCLPPG